METSSRTREPAGLVSARAHAGTSGALIASSPLPLALAARLDASAPGREPVLLAGLGSIAALTLMAGLLLVARPLAARVLASGSAVGLLALSSPSLARHPLLALTILVATTLGLALLWDTSGALFWDARRGPVLPARARAACTTAMCGFLGLAFTNPQQGALETAAILTALGLAGLLALHSAWYARRRSGRRPLVAILLAAALGGSLALALHAHPIASTSALAVLPAAALLVLRRRARSNTDLEPTSFFEPLLGHPQRLFVGTFASLSLLGALLLALPQSSTIEEGIGFLDALFTSVSAVCVTGLIVLDTPVVFSGFGQAILLLLIQIGGLGIMTFSTAALRFLGRRMSLRHEGAVAALISTRDRGQLFQSARRILIVTFSLEAAGCALLWIAFASHGEPLGPALWRAVFTAVSAFCNAGFALQSDSLAAYQEAPAVLHTVAALAALGALSPAAIVALPRLARGRDSPVPAQTRLNLATAAGLLLAGFVAMLALEWNGVLGHLPWPDRLHNAWLHSVTLRSTGFNSIDTAAVQPAMLGLMLLLMFIGGSPGSTAGGIKTTTAAVLAISAVKAVRGQWTLEVFGRRVPEQTRHKAAAVAILAALAVVGAFVTLELTQSLPARLALFEVVSALGTVGLSIGATARLDDIGKILIIACMFVGRVGGLAMLMLLAGSQRSTRVGHPAEEIDVG